jgi:hypothetical protein
MMRTVRRNAVNTPPLYSLDPTGTPKAPAALPTGADGPGLSRLRLDRHRILMRRDVSPGAEAGDGSACVRLYNFFPQDQSQDSPQVRQTCRTKGVPCMVPLFLFDKSSHSSHNKSVPRIKDRRYTQRNGQRETNQVVLGWRSANPAPRSLARRPMRPARGASPPPVPGYDGRRLSALVLSMRRSCGCLHAQASRSLGPTSLHSTT